MNEVTPQAGVLRILRGVTLATLSVLLAVAAHVAGGGRPPSGALAVLLTVAMVVAAAALADRRRGPAAVLVAVATVQVVTHVLLAALDGHHAVAAGGELTTPMLGWHAAAVVLTAGLLATGEAALFTLAGALRRLGDRLLLPAPADRTRPPVPLPGPDASLCRVLFATRLRLRGPPVVS